MSAEKLSPELSIPESFQKYYGVKVIIRGPAPIFNPNQNLGSNYIWGVVTELTSNCVENRIPNRKIGAKNITVIFEPGKVTVEDDFVYANPEPVLELILRIRDSGKPFTTKPLDDGFPDGGIGILTSTSRLQKLGGKLNYYIKNGTIVAVATFDPQKILNPFD